MWKLFMNGMIQKNRKIFFTNLYESIVCEMDLITGNIVTLCKLFMDDDTYESHKELCIVENKLVIAPCRGNDIFIYNIENKTATRIELEINYDTEYKFNQIITYENYVFLIGTRYPAIIRIDTRTNDIVYITSCYKEYIKGVLGYDDNYFTSGDTIGSYAYLPFACEPAILEMDLNTCETKKISVKCDRKEGFNGLRVCDENLWAIDLYGEYLYKIDFNGNIILSRNEGCRVKYAYHTPIINNNRIILLPCNAEKVIVHDLNDIQITYPCDELCEYYKRGTTEKAYRSTNLLLDDGGILINIQGKATMIWKNDMIKVINMKPTKELLTVLVPNCLVETDEIVLQDFLKLIEVL